MARRYVSIWFQHLVGDYMVKRDPSLLEAAFVLTMQKHGRMIITGASARAQRSGAVQGMVLADARAIIPHLRVLENEPQLADRLLDGIGKWCIRFTPCVAVDPPSGLMLDASGCAHLWGGEQAYIDDIANRLKKLGYSTRIAIADTPGCAWAVARFSQHSIIAEGDMLKALLPLPAAALRLDTITTERLLKLGLRHIKNFISKPRRALQRRFGDILLQRIDQAMGMEYESIIPLVPIIPYQERLPCLDPIRTATGIEIALQRILEALCDRLQKEGKGIRKAIFKAICVDHRVESIEIGTNRGSHNGEHLFKLFAEKIQQIEPGLGIELFILEASHVEEMQAQQEVLWTGGCGLGSVELAELLDRITNKFGENVICRYLPAQHHWPERSITSTTYMQQQPSSAWPDDLMRPTHLLPEPEPIEVTAPIPDYPPMNFRYKGKLHNIKKAETVERIEREWWIDGGEHRDYYYVEDDEGKRYWLFRSGHYTGDKTYSWFIHGFFP